MATELEQIDSLVQAAVDTAWEVAAEAYWANAAMLAAILAFNNYIPLVIEAHNARLATLTGNV